jgi:hypothetical protein
MRTQEVSLVDIAANMRRFVTMKEMGDMNIGKSGLAGDEQDGGGQELAPGVKPGSPSTGSGVSGDAQEPGAPGLPQGVSPSSPASLGSAAESTLSDGPVQEYKSQTPVANAAPPPPHAPPAAPAAPPPPAAPPAGAAPPDAGGGLKLPGAVKSAMIDGLSQLLDKLSSVAEAVNGAAVDDTAPVPPQLGQMFEGCDAILDGLMSQYGVPDPDAAQAPPGGAPPPPAQKSADGAAMSEIAMAAAGVAKAAVAVSTAKIGRKMAQPRLTMLKQAYDILSGLLKELVEQHGATDDIAGAPPPPQDLPPAPAEGMVPNSAPPQRQMAPAPQQKSLDDAPPAWAKKLVEDVQGLSASLSTLNARQTALSGTVTQVAKRAGIPLANQPEKTETPIAKSGVDATKPFVWGNDLAATAAANQTKNGAAAPVNK